MLWQKQLDKALSVIDEALSEYKNPYMSMSWGKDSIFLYFLLREIKPDIPVIYVNSGYALPDTYAIRNRIIKEYNPNYYEIDQPTDYIELCKIVGLPHERSRQDQKNAVQLIKKNVLDDFALSQGFDLCFWGIRNDESKGRLHMFMKNGFFVRTTQMHKCHPIALITLQQLWYFYDKLKLPMNEIYNKTLFLDRFQIRNTGWISTDGAENGKIQWLKYYYPDYFLKLLNEFPNIKAYV